MKILISGPQGSGKTTQAELLAADLAVPHFSSGEFLRTLARENSEVGRIVKKHIAAGTLIPDDLALKLVSDELEKLEYNTGFVLEGNPRTVEQAENFKHKLDVVIYLKLPDGECVKRLLNRRRSDDTEELIKTRLTVYHKETEPMLDYYRKLKLLHRVDGLGSIESIHNTIAEIVGIENHAAHQI